MSRLSKLIIIISISILFGLPHLVGMLSISPYISTVVAGVTPYSFDENHYAVRIKKVFSTGLPVSDAYTYEYRYSPYVFFPFSTYLLGLFAKLIGSVQNSFIVADFIFPPIIFLTLYGLMKVLLKDDFWAVLGALIILLEDQIVGFITPLLQMLTSFSVTPIVSYLSQIYSPPFYSRLENPEFSSIFFFLGLYCLIINFQQPQFRFRIGLLISIVMLVYSYPFYSIFLMVASMFFLLQAVIKGNIFLKELFILGLCLLVLCSPYLVELYRFSQLPQAVELSMRWGRETKWPYVPPTAVLTFIIFTVYTLRSNSKKSFHILSILLGISIFFLFIFPVQTDHIVTRVIVPILRMSQIYFIYILFIDRFPAKLHLKKRFAISMILLLFSVSFIHAWYYSKTSISAFTISPYVLEAYKWLDDNANNNDVVLSYSIETNFQLPAFANTYMFLPYGMLTFAPTSEIKERLRLAYKAIKADPSQLASVVGYSPTKGGRWRPTSEELETKGGFMYFVKQGENIGGYGFANKELEQFILEYKNTSETSLAEIVKDFKLDYLYWGSFEKTHYLLPVGVENKVFENEKVTIYKI
ncbi:MAG: hypothetical protein AAB874_04065 [Patescibacteria group bacterium]